MRNVIWLVVCTAIATGLFLLLRPAPPPPSETRRGILAQEDLESGTYALVFSYGVDMPAVPGNDSPAWLVVDQALIAAHRDAIDIGFSFLDFVPGERGIRRYMYVFRDGVKIRGQLVSASDQIIVPQAIVDAARIVEQKLVDGNRSAMEAALPQLLSQGALVDRDNGPGAQNPQGEFYFFAQFPTLAVAEGSDFDPQVYARTLEERLRAAGPDGDYWVEVSIGWERPPGTVYFTEDGGWSRVLTPEGEVATINTLWLYDYRASVYAGPELYDDLAAIDLAALVADQRNEALIIAEYLNETEASEAPDEITVEGYETGGWGDLIETRYGLRYWQ